MEENNRKKRKSKSRANILRIAILLILIILVIYLIIRISTDDENNGKEYLFSMSISGGSVDIYDFEQESISSAYQLMFYNSKNIQSLVSSIFKSSYQPDSKYYYIFAQTALTLEIFM